MLTYKTAKMFLGLGNYDCLLCHNGRGHLEQINLWASGVQRSDAEQMSAFLSHERHTGYRGVPRLPTDTSAFYSGSSIVSEATSTNSSYTLAYDVRQPSQPVADQRKEHGFAHLPHRPKARIEQLASGIRHACW